MFHRSIARVGVTAAAAPTCTRAAVRCSAVQAAARTTCRSACAAVRRNATATFTGAIRAPRLRLPGATATAGALASPVAAVGRWCGANPFWFQMIVGTAKTAACDLLIQVYVEKRDSIDWKRNAVFMAFGSVYLSGFQYLLYSIWMPRLFPNAVAFANLPFRAKLRDMAGLRTLAKQVAFDNFVHNPIVYFPVFYCLKSLLDAKVEGQSAVAAVQEQLGTYKRHFAVDNLSMCALVIPGDILAFGAPMWLRLPASHAVSFAWVCYLSFLRGGSAAEVVEAAPAVEVEVVVADAAATMPQQLQFA